MGSGHGVGSQKKLQGLFGDFSTLVEKRIAAALKAIARNTTCESKPIRVLDIGAGHVPYRHAFEQIKKRHHLHVETLDNQKETIKNPWADGNWVWEDVFTRYDILRPNRKTIPPEERFDLVILAATLHELFYDAVVKHRQPQDFHLRILQYIRKELLTDSGQLIIADYAWLQQEIGRASCRERV